MTKLFVAADLPPDVLRTIERSLPVALPGIRMSDPGQLHLTLHYIGEADLDSVRGALQSVVAEPFAHTVRGVGQFDGAKGSKVIWAGVELSDALNRLHEAVARALSAVGFVPESRPYSPHITLARCDASVSPEVVDAFSAAVGPLDVTGMIESFTLFSSAIVDTIPVYTVEATFPLGR
jgi:RNA 2',3'-cyclic 3'-phosphodiesterase